jgi:hypothetical protein
MDSQTYFRARNHREVLSPLLKLLMLQCSILPNNIHRNKEWLNYENQVKEKPLESKHDLTQINK